MMCASKPANSCVSESRKVGKIVKTWAWCGVMVLKLLMTNRKSILPRQPVGPGGPKSGSGSTSVLDVSPDDGDGELVELAEPPELAEVSDPLVVEVEPTDAVMSGMDSGPAPKLDAAGVAGLHANMMRATRDRAESAVVMAFMAPTSLRGFCRPWGENARSDTWFCARGAHATDPIQRPAPAGQVHGPSLQRRHCGRITLFSCPPVISEYV